MCKCRSHGTFPLFGLQSSHLNICYYHQDLHRRPLRPGSRPGFCSDRRASYSSGLGPCPNGRVSAQLGTVTQLPVHPASPVLLTKNGPLGALDSMAWLNRAATPSYLFKSDERFARQYRCGPPPEFPLASPRSGIVHHLSGPDRYALTRTLHKDQGRSRCNPQEDPTNQLPCALRVYSPVDSHTCQTPWSVFQDGSNGEPTGRRQERKCRSTPNQRALPSTIVMMTSPRAFQQPRLGPPSQSASVNVSSRLADRHKPFHIRPRHIAGPIRFPPDNFKHSLTLFSKSFSSFPLSRYLFAIGLSPIFSLGRNLPPDWGCIPKQPDSPTAPRGATGSEHNGALTLSGAPFQGTWARSAAEDASPDYNSNAEGDRFSWWAYPGSLAVTKGILVSFFSSAY
ncbi:hypothetical protein KIW84_071134 [Lathyrus oleraceus]|uniref:Senescence-associated protein n=1 Tax=Pisum sativum TaxID=3888 RepID=A0A9D4ZSS8_PEA|nr:hypothetical protein KIW84_071134 [Pisum sativum]